MVFIINECIYYMFVNLVVFVICYVKVGLNVWLEK